MEDDKKKTAKLSEVVAKAVETALELKAGGVIEKEVREAIVAEKFADAPHRSESGKAVVKNFVAELLVKEGLADSSIVDKDLSTTVDVDGGITVPTEFRTAIVEKRVALGQGIRNYATVLPMPTGKLDLTAEDVSVSVNWTTELDVITQSNPKFKAVHLVAQNLAGIVRISRQLVDRSGVSPRLVDWLVAQFAKAIDKAENTAFMVGSGTGQPKGIRSETLTSLAQAGASLSDDDLVKLYFTLPAEYRQYAIWIMPDTVLGKIAQLRSTDGRRLHETVLGSTPTILSRPVIVNNSIPANLGTGTNESEIYFGDASYYVIGDTDEMLVETSTEEGSSFERHRMAIKAFAALDGELSLTAAFVKLTGVK